MDRMKVLTSKEEFLKVFPDKKSLVVDYSLAEIYCLMLRLRSDISIRKEIIHSKDEEGFEFFKNTFSKFFEISDNTIGIVNGVVSFPREMVIEDFILLKKLLLNDNKFSEMLFGVHTDGMKEFISVNQSSLCGNALLHCSEEEFMAVLNSIDFEFTTVNNLLTATRADLVKSDTYGKIRTDTSVFIVNMTQSYKDNNCLGVFIDKLRK